MGVPGFVAWLTKKYKKADIILTNITDNIDILYIDANCLFHPQCHKVLDYYGEKLSVIELENKMMERILNFIDYLIGLCNPSKEVFIAVDGVAPMAKVNQQRKRRYKAIQDNEMRNNIKRKYNKPITTIWNNTVITPGTEFMERLHLRLVEYIKSNRLNLKIKYTYSSYHTIGEGEHKILQDIRAKPKNEDTYVVYGLDADLVFLSLASNKENMYLLREETFFKGHNNESDEIVDIVTDVAEELNYLSIDEIRKSINDQFNVLIDGKMEMNEYGNIDFTNDFIVMCFLLGNDFLPNIPSIDIKNSGLDLVLDVYIETFLKLENTLLNDKYIFNNEFFDIFFEKISKYEDYYFRVRYPKYLEYISRRKCQSNDIYDIAVWNMENMRNMKVDDPIKLGCGSPDIWKYNYYNHYYGITKNQQIYVDNMCREYFKGIMWTIDYYFKECPSYEWQYLYYNAPFASDIYDFLIATKYDLNKIKFSNNKNHLNPLSQLLSVIPPSCTQLLPQGYANLMSSSSVIDLFPIKVPLDFLYKDNLHKCMPLIPNIDIKRIMDATKNIKLSKSESERNKILNNFVA